MPDITDPGDVLAPITAGAASAATIFTSTTRANALVEAMGTQDWAYSTDDVNFFNVPANSGQLIPYLAGQNGSRTIFFKRTGAVDSVISLLVAG